MMIYATAECPKCAYEYTEQYNDMPRINVWSECPACGTRFKADVVTDIVLMAIETKEDE